jgi:hypothetical protein
MYMAQLMQTSCDTVSCVSASASSKVVAISSACRQAALAWGQAGLSS